MNLRIDRRMYPPEFMKKKGRRRRKLRDRGVWTFHEILPEIARGSTSQGFTGFGLSCSDPMWRPPMACIEDSGTGGGDGGTRWYSQGGIFDALTRGASSIIEAIRGSGQGAANVAGQQAYAYQLAQQQSMMQNFLYMGVAIAGVVAITTILKK